MDKKILFVGAGSMAEAMIAGIVKSEIVESSNIYVTNRQDKTRLEEMKTTYAVQTSYNQEQLFEVADIVFLAMKPKDIEASLKLIRPFIRKEQLIISVIAGVETKTIEDYLHVKVPVVRAMPNTSATVRYSTTAIVKGQYSTEEDVALAEKLLQTIGVTKIVSEADIDVVTAISGSGPAYLYYFVEAIKQAAKEAGLAEDLAEELMTHTIIGAGKMLAQSDETPEVLRKNVTSEGGVTQAGIEALTDNRFQEAIISCIEEARKRSEELADQYRMIKS